MRIYNKYDIIDGANINIYTLKNIYKDYNYIVRVEISLLTPILY